MMDKQHEYGGETSVVLNRLHVPHSLRTRKDVTGLAPLLSDSLFPGESPLSLSKEMGIRLEDSDWDEALVVEDILSSSNSSLVLVEEDDERLVGVGNKGGRKRGRTIVIRRKGSVCSLVSLLPHHVRDLERRLDIESVLPSRVVAPSRSPSPPSSSSPSSSSGG